MPITKRVLEPVGENRSDEIRHYNLDVDQGFDQRTGKPTGRPVLNQMTINITRDSEEEAPFYIQWQCDPSTTKDLDIGFYDGTQLKRSVKIRGAYLIGYSQDSSEPGTVDETLVLSPASVETDGVKFSRIDYI